MASNDSASSWVLIQQGVRETERLIGQKQYNLSMIKARQTLEYMVKTLAERYGVTDGDLIDTIDELYRSRAISKTTCEHYHKIRMIGNKAAHDGDDNAYNANSAYHLLSQEVYTFADESSMPKRSRRQRPTSSKPKTTGAKQISPGARQISPGTIRKKKQSSDSLISPYTLLKLIIPILVVILLIAIIKMFTGNDSKKETMPESTMPVTVATTAYVPATTAPAAVVTYTTNARLNVRTAPSTDGEKITTLDPGTEVEFVKVYDDTWSVIMYDGGEAYVSSKYLTASEETSASSSEEGSEGESSEEETTTQ